MFAPFISDKVVMELSVQFLIMITLLSFFVYFWLHRQQIVVTKNQSLRSCCIEFNEHLDAMTVIIKKTKRVLCVGHTVVILCVASG